ncbi:Neurexin-1 [Halotydeus destructor]|nr:Neurexin-1 [Halotydeus destructor]
MGVTELTNSGTLLFLISWTISLIAGDSISFDGAQGSYAKFDKWQPNLNGSLSFEVRTESQDGLLLYTDDNGHTDYVILKLINGLIRLHINLGHGTTIVSADDRPISDGHWHSVEIVRSNEETQLKVDDHVYSSLRPMRGSDFEFGHYQNNSAIYFAGLPDSLTVLDMYKLTLPWTLFEARFQGSVRNVRFASDEKGSRVDDQKPISAYGLRSNGHRSCDHHDPCQHGGSCLSTDRGATCDCSRVAFEGTFCQKGLFEVYGTIGKQCQAGNNYTDPVTFTTAESYLALPRWSAIKSGSLSLKIRTNEPNGLLLYSIGADNGPDHEPDVLALELLDGHLFMLINLGAGPVKVKGSIKKINDGQWHLIGFNRTAKFGRITVDENSVDFISPGNSNQLDLESPMYLGSLGTLWNQRKHHGQVPGQLWSLSVARGFVGCVRDVAMDDQMLDIAQLAQHQDFVNIKASCYQLPPFCPSSPCKHGGKCLEGWNRFTCDCSTTTYSGPKCDREAKTLTFAGEQLLEVILNQISVTQADEIRLRFRTTNQNGLLYIKWNSVKTVNYFIISLDTGRLKVTINMGEGNKVMLIGRNLADNLWHSVVIVRRGPSLEGDLDGARHMSEINGQMWSLTTNKMALGYLDTDMTIENSTPLYLSIKDISRFRGQLQHVLVNSLDLIDSVLSGHFLNYSLTASLEHLNEAYNLVHFKSHDSFIGLPSLKVYSAVNIRFSFRTSHANGLVLYNGGKGQNFVCFELVGGHLSYLFNTGDGPTRIRSTNGQLSDDRWHSVTVTRIGHFEYVLLVDSVQTRSSRITVTGNGYLELGEFLYIGGLPEPMYSSLPRTVSSTSGFSGCLGSVEVNDEVIDPGGEDVLMPSNLVEPGCSDRQATRSKCTSSTCTSKGTCSEDDFSGQITCQCDRTFFAWPTCAGDDVVYKFGPRGGIIIYTLPQQKRQDTNMDNVTFAVVTRALNAVLFRVDSSSSADYVELRLVNGAIFGLYNLGQDDHAVGDPAILVSDSKYHVISFTRSGANATIQVDNYNAIEKRPLGKQRNIFDNQSTLQIGGKRNVLKSDSIELPFVGILAGVLFDNQRILEDIVHPMAKVIIDGDIEPLNREHSEGIGTSKSSTFQNLTRMKPHEVMQVHVKLRNEENEGSNYDDHLIVSGQGTCWSDSDCPVVKKKSSADDLISPVLLHVPPTVSSHDRKEPCYTDDEDNMCDFEGSGSSPNSVKTPLMPDYSTPTTSRRPQPAHRWPKLTPAPTFDSFDKFYAVTTQRPLSTLVDYDQKMYVYTSRPIPPPEAPPVHHTFRPSPTKPTGRPVIVNVPKPQSPHQSTSLKDNTKMSKVKPTGPMAGPTPDKPALIIGLIAMLIITIVVIAPFILFFRSREVIGQTMLIANNLPANGNMLITADQAISRNQAYNQQAISRCEPKKSSDEWFV